MKRDMDLCREILRMVEDAPSTDLRLASDWLDDVRLYHVQQLENAGLLERRSALQNGTLFVRLTWAGHDFVDASRDQTLWEKAKQIALQKSGGLALDAVKVALSELAKAAVKSAIGN